MGDVEYKFYLFFVLVFESKLWGKYPLKTKKLKLNTNIYDIQAGSNIGFSFVAKQLLSCYNINMFRRINDKIMKGVAYHE